MSIDHSAVIDRFEAILTANITPVFAAVFPGEPLGLPLGGPYAAFWYLGRGIGTRSGEMSMGNAMITESWSFACWWPREPERATLERWENDISDADQAIQTAIRGDSQLSGLCSDLWVDGSSVGYRSFPLGSQPKSLYRALTFTVHIEDLEGEAIAA
jgi:hypothetical protein